MRHHGFYFIFLNSLLFVSLFCSFSLCFFVLLFCQRKNKKNISMKFTMSQSMRMATRPINHTIYLLRQKRHRALWWASHYVDTPYGWSICCCAFIFLLKHLKFRTTIGTRRPLRIPCMFHRLEQCRRRSIIQLVHMAKSLSISLFLFVHP